MATVDGLTKERMLAIEAESITAARIDGVTNHLIFTTHGGTDIDAGNVQGPVGPVGPVGPAGPTGSIVEYAGAAAPAGWLLCDGSAVLRATYAALFAVIGTAFGVGNGTTTFNVPDIRGKVTVGAGAGAGLTNRVLAATGGEETHVSTIGEMPAHNHPITDPGHRHPHTLGGADFVHTVASSSQYLSGGPGQAVTWGDGTDSDVTGVTTNNVGGGAGHNNMQPFVVVFKIIKT